MKKGGYKFEKEQNRVYSKDGGKGGKIKSLQSQK